MERIASFTVDHDVLVPGLYLSRRDGDVVTFDLRFKKPNTGDLLTNAELHSVEHIIATLLRVFAQGAAFEGAMPGKSARECGNYRNLDVETAKRCCAYYAEVISAWDEAKLAYPVVGA